MVSVFLSRSSNFEDFQPLELDHLDGVKLFKNQPGRYARIARGARCIDS